MDRKSNLRPNYHQGQPVNNKQIGRKYSTPQRISLSSTRTNSLSSQRSKSKSKRSPSQNIKQLQSPKIKRKGSPYPLKNQQIQRSRSKSQGSQRQNKNKNLNHNTDKNVCQYWNQGQCLKENTCNKQHYKNTQIVFFQNKKLNFNEQNQLMKEGKTAIRIHKTVWLNNHQLAQAINTHKDDLQTSIIITQNTKAIKMIKNKMRKINRDKFLNQQQKTSQITQIINEEIMNTQDDKKQSKAQKIIQKIQKIKEIKKQRAEENQKQINLIEIEDNNNTQVDNNLNQNQIVTKLQQLKNKIKETKRDELQLNQEEQQQYVKLLVNDFNQSHHQYNQPKNNDAIIIENNTDLSLESNNENDQSQQQPELKLIQQQYQQYPQDSNTQTNMREKIKLYEAQVEKKNTITVPGKQLELKLTDTTKLNLSTTNNQ